MQLSKKALQELQEILRRDYQLVVSDEQANAIGVKLLGITKISLKAAQGCVIEGCGVSGNAGCSGAFKAPIVGTHS